MNKKKNRPGVPFQPLGGRPNASRHRLSREAQEAQYLARQVIRAVVDPNTPITDPELAEVKRMTMHYSPQDREEIVEAVMQELFSSDAPPSKTKWME